MVCLGNICRSPLAQGILESKVNSKRVRVDSAGTAAYHTGNPPDPRSIAIANKYGISIQNQKARQFLDQNPRQILGTESGSQVKNLLSRTYSGPKICHGFWFQNCLAF